MFDQLSQRLQDVFQSIRGESRLTEGTVENVLREIRMALLEADVNVKVVKASGKAKLHSYVIHHRKVPGFTPPYAIAVVELPEGPRMMTNIVDCPQTPEALVLDMPLEVVFEPMDDQITLPFFRPARG